MQTFRLRTRCCYFLTRYRLPTRRVPINERIPIRIQIPVQRRWIIFSAENRILRQEPPAIRVVIPRPHINEPGIHISFMPGEHPPVHARPVLVGDMPPRVQAVALLYRAHRIRQSHGTAHGIVVVVLLLPCRRCVEPDQPVRIAVMGQQALRRLLALDQDGAVVIEVLDIAAIAAQVPDPQPLGVVVVAALDAIFAGRARQTRAYELVAGVVGELQGRGVVRGSIVVPVQGVAVRVIAVGDRAKSGFGVREVRECQINGRIEVLDPLQPVQVVITIEAVPVYGAVLGPLLRGPVEALVGVGRALGPGRAFDSEVQELRRRVVLIRSRFGRDAVRASVGIFAVQVELLELLLAVAVQVVLVCMARYERPQRCRGIGKVGWPAAPNRLDAARGVVGVVDYRLVRVADVIRPVVRVVAVQDLLAVVVFYLS
jgi:hypothetical protein